MPKQPVVSYEEVTTLCVKRINALLKYVTGAMMVKTGGVSHPVADVVAIYQANIDGWTAVNRKRAELEAALFARRAAEKTRHAFDKDLKEWVSSAFGLGSVQADAFGFAPPKKGKKTVEVKAQAAAKARATRLARGTKGKRQKKNIKG